MYKLHKILLLFFLGLPNVSLADDYLEYKVGLDDHIKSIKNSLVIYKSSAMISEKTANNSKFVFINSELNNAGRDLLKYLQDNEKVYSQLAFDDWVQASYDLLEFDKWLSKEKAWGNLVIKVAVCNTILYRIWRYLDESNEQVNSEDILKLIQLQEELRQHFPVSKAMYEIGLRHYGLIDKIDVRAFKVDEPIRLNEKTASSYLFHLTDDREKFSDKLMGLLLNEWDTVVIRNYMDLYDNPVPLAMAFSSEHFHVAWDVYLYTIILQDLNSNTSYWSDLKEKDIEIILQKIYKSDGRFWMSKSTVFFLENFITLERPEGSNSLVSRILSKEFLSDIKRIAKDSESRSKNIDNAIKLLPNVAL